MIILISISAANATDVSNSTTDISSYDEIRLDSSSNLSKELSNANDNDIIILEKGTYKISDFEITKNLTIKGIADPLDGIIDGEKKSSIFLIRNDA